MIITSLPCHIQPYSFLEWEASGKGLSTKMVTSLLGGVPPRGGTAVVLNAKGGREVSAISKAGLKVLATYSEAKETFPGLLEDSKTGKKWGGTDGSAAEEQVEKGPTDPAPTETAGAGQLKGKEKTAEYAESVAGDTGRNKSAEDEDEARAEIEDELAEAAAEGEEGESEPAEGEDEEGGEEPAEGEEGTTEEKREEGAGDKEEEKAAGTAGDKAAGGSGEAGESIAGSSDPYTLELKRLDAEKGE